MKISEMEEKIKDPNIKIGISAPAIVDPWHYQKGKGSSFNDVLKKIKSHHPKNTITTGNVSQV